jgi:hypothetical protein
MKITLKDEIRSVIEADQCETIDDIIDSFLKLQVVKDGIRFKWMIKHLGTITLYGKRYDPMRCDIAEMIDDHEKAKNAYEKEMRELQEEAGFEQC